MGTPAELIGPAVSAGDLVLAVLSDRRAKSELEGLPPDCRRVNARPVVVKGAAAVQLEYLAGPKALHENLPPEQAAARLQAFLPAFRQARIQTRDALYHITMKANGQAVVRRKSAAAEPTAAHDRAKHRLLPEGQPVDFLVRLGVMTADGRVVAARYDKFRQVNRFLEMVDDVARALPTEGVVRVVDFGCGRSYLTFALHHYLRSVRGLDARIAGLDLKQDVVAECGTLAGELGCEGLCFRAGDIRGFEPAEGVDMVVSLHACDTATDDALAQAVRWGAKVILAAPCCQHEVARKLDSPAMRPLLKHGILRERLGALVTDALRAERLELAGYRVQVLEFIETEHTPKNLLIRAVKEESRRPGRRLQQNAAFRAAWGLETTYLDEVLPLETEEGSPCAEQP